MASTTHTSIEIADLSSRFSKSLKIDDQLPYSDQNPQTHDTQSVSVPKPTSGALFKHLTAVFQNIKREHRNQFAVLVVLKLRMIKWPGLADSFEVDAEMVARDRELFQALREKLTAKGLGTHVTRVVMRKGIRAVYARFPERGAMATA